MPYCFCFLISLRTVPTVFFALRRALRALCFSVETGTSILMPRSIFAIHGKKSSASIGMAHDVKHTLRLHVSNMDEKVVTVTEERLNSYCGALIVQRRMPHRASDGRGR